MQKSLNKALVKLELRTSIRGLSTRGLYHSTKWAAELMTQIDTEDMQPVETTHCAVPVDSEVEDAVTLAKTFFDLREYQRAAFCLQEESSPVALFLRCYSSFLAGEKRKEEEMLEKPDPLQRSQVMNKQLKILKQELEPLHAANKLDGFCLFMFGIVLKELDQKERAVEVLTQSVTVYPWNWSAWKALVALSESREAVTALKLPDHWMRLFFLADAFLELHQHDHEKATQLLGLLEQEFPNSTHVLAQRAVAHYNARDFDEAQQKFEELREVDPFRLDGMDIYSNILYVKECKGALSFLAHNAVTNNKYQPQTCCIVGNYYSLKGKHEKAVLYFQRALKLNPSYLSAWTLMGHEYVEMRNTSAAIEAYRRAVDINPRDYRAWYGLGQTYEILQMHTYSLYYFRKATNLRPYDSRMWCAMAECYERLMRIEDAIKCYLRAEGNDDREGIALNKLAKLYSKLGDSRMAAHFFEKVLARRGDDEEADAEVGQDTIDALLFLAEHYKSNSKFQEAEQCCNQLLDIGGPAKEQAKSLLMEIRQLNIFMRASPES